MLERRQEGEKNPTPMLDDLVAKALERFWAVQDGDLDDEDKCLVRSFVEGVIIESIVPPSDLTVILIKETGYKLADFDEISRVFEGETWEGVFQQMAEVVIEKAVYDRYPDLADEEERRELVLDSLQQKPK